MISFSGKTCDAEQHGTGLMTWGANDCTDEGVGLIELMTDDGLGMIFTEGVSLALRIF